MKLKHRLRVESVAQAADSAGAGSVVWHRLGARDTMWMRIVQQLSRVQVQHRGRCRGLATSW